MHDAAPAVHDGAECLLESGCHRLAWVAPHGLEKTRLENLGQILRQAIDLGNAVEDFIARARGRAQEAGEGGRTHRTAGRQAPVRGRLPGRGRPVPPRAREGRQGRRSRGAQPAGPALPGPARPRQEDRPPRAGLEGHPGGARDRQGRSRAEGRGDPPGRRADPQDQGSAGPGLARGELHPAARAGHGDHRRDRRRGPRGCRPTPSMPTSA